MKLEDRYKGEMCAVTEFDFERFVEGVARNLQKEDDARDFSYANEILRPRHLIALYEVLLKAAPNTLFSATAPVVKFDGDNYEVKSRAVDTFEDLCKCLEDLILTQSFTILYSVSRMKSIDPGTFESRTVFKLRFVDLT